MYNVIHAQEPPILASIDITLYNETLVPMSKELSKDWEVDEGDVCEVITGTTPPKSGFIKLMMFHF